MYWHQGCANTGTIHQKRGQGRSANTYFKNNSSKLFSCIRTSANTGPTCIRSKINSSRSFSCMYRFCAGGQCENLSADFREGDEDSNFSVFRARRFNEWPEPLHWIAFPVEILTKPLIHWNCLPPFHSKPPFSHWKVLRRIPFPKIGSDKTLCDFEPQIWPAIIRSREKPKVLVLKAQGRHVMWQFLAFLDQILVGKDHMTWWMLSADYIPSDTRWSPQGSSVVVFDGFCSLYQTKPREEKTDVFNEVPREIRNSWVYVL